jgi:hypothetical protein
MSLGTAQVLWAQLHAYLCHQTTKTSACPARNDLLPWLPLLLLLPPLQQQVLPVVLPAVLLLPPLHLQVPLLRRQTKTLSRTMCSRL